MQIHHGPNPPPAWRDGREPAEPRLPARSAHRHGPGTNHAEVAAKTRGAEIAVAHSALVSGYHVLAEGRPYDEHGGDYFLRREDPEHITRRLVRQLERLGQRRYAGTRGRRGKGAGISKQNVDIARHAVDALNRGDLAGAMKGTATDFAFDFSRSRSPERGVYGREDIPRLQDALGGAWESVRWELEEFIEAGGQLITPITTCNRGRDGIELQARVAWLWRFRNGRIARITFFQDRREALEAAGLND